jgi:Putative Ig domain
VTVSLGDAKELHDKLSVWANGASLISGLTTTAGQFIHPSYSAQVTGGQLAIRIASQGSVNPTFAINALDIAPASAGMLTLGPTTLANATVNSAYGVTLSATGGTGTYTFAVTSGSLPSWLALNANTGALSGMPTTSGTSSFTITATDSNTTGLTGSQVYTLLVNAGSSGNEPLLYQSNLQYVGAFRVPAVPDPLTPGSYTYSYGGTALAFNSANHSLFIDGIPFDQAVSEISIPQSIVNSSDISSLATANVLQPPVQVLSKLPSNPLAGGTGGVNIGGLMVDNGRLVGTAYIGYDTTNAAVSHFTLSSLNLSTAQVGGLYQVGNLGGGLVAGYMAPIPSEWQAALGAPYLTGQADLNIISRTSSGPGAFGFDTKALGSGVAPITPYVYYPVNTPLGPYEGPADPLQSGTTQVNGVVFAPGTSSVLFFGTTGTNYEGYGLPSTYGDNNHTYKGPHSLNGEYAFQVWAYNVNDFIAVKQGTLQPWQVQPYDVWNFTLPNATGSSQIGGVAFDPATGRVYVSVVNVDNVTPYTNLPLIEVFQLTTIQPATPPGPQVGTLAATPSTLAPGAIPQGTPVTLTAGNVYAINNGASVAQVAFYLDSNNDGVLQTSTDKLLGYGTPSNVPNAGHNWTLTISTSGMLPGTYTIFAQAMDASGLFSNPIATTFTIQ